MVPRHDAPRRHSLDVLGELVRHAGQDRAVRRRRTRQRAAACTASWCADPRLYPTKSSRRTAPISAAISAHTHWTTTIIKPIAGLVESRHAAFFRRQLGRPRPASARQFRRFRARRVKAEMAGSARHRTLDSFLHRLWPRRSSCVSSIISCQARKRTGRSSRKCCCRSAIRAKNSCHAPKTNGRSSARKWTKFYLDPADWR